jgi:Peptidase A4 family
MVRRWCIPLLTLPLVVGSLLTAGAASAAPGLAHHAAQAVNLGHPMIRPVGVGQPSLGSDLNTVALSSNWAGFAVTGRRGAFRSVSSAWVQPTARCRGVAGHRFAAFWVGLDGFNSRSVEQTGADSDCFHGRPVYYTWFEMFPKPPVLFRTRLNPGDHMSASVTFVGAGRYVLVIHDATRHWTHRIVRSHAGLARSSAEWIAEAPATVTGSILPLANFGKVRWTNSRANGHLLRRLARTRIVMVNAARQIKCSTSLVSSTDVFTNTWHRSF